MILRYLIALPCYNNGDTVEKMILDTLRETQFPVLVIDDGSDQPVQDVVTHPEALAALTSGRLTFQRHPENQGKGCAIQTAFSWALKNNFTHVLTCDTDGQHLTSQIPKTIERSREHPWSLIIGSRKWQGEVPGSSKFGRKFSNFWVNFETGYRALDSQSGFRIYPVFQVQNMSFYTSKYDFEIEVLIRLLWNHVDVQEVDIEVYYPPGEKRITHFNKFSDNVRISVLNFILVTVSLLRGHLDPARSGTALGLGVMIGMTPFLGIHTIIAAGAALLFRLNFLLLVIGSQIGLPIFLPVIAMASVRVGKIILARPGASAALHMPRTLHAALALSKTFFLEWLVGSVVLGIVVGTIVGGIYYFAKKWYARKSARTWSGKTRGGTVGNGVLRLILKHLGLKAGYFCLYFVVPYFYFFAPRARSAVSKYWHQMAPESAWFRKQRRIFRHFYVFGQVLMDRVYQSYHQQLVFRVHREGPGHIEQVSNSGRGWVFVGAHVGGWDISSLFFKKDPRSSRLGMVHFLGDGLTFDKVLKRGAESTKVDSIESNSGEGSLIVVKNFLQENRHVGFLADRAIGSQVELVLFLGKLAPFETRPFRVAAMCKAPMIYTYTFKTGEKDYAFYSTDPGELKYTGDRDRRLQVYDWTERFVRDLEKQMRNHPHQWFNFYPFWSSQPKEMPGTGSGRQDNYLLEELRTPANPAAVPGSGEIPNA